MTSPYCIDDDNIVSTFSFSFEGKQSDNHVLDFYDASQALLGFQRSLALTAHLVLNDEIIIQAPSLRNAYIFVSPPEEGSWKIKTKLAVVGGILYAAGFAPNNTVVGHLVYSVYDYIIKETLGTHVDFNKSLLKLYEENQITKEQASKLKVPDQSRLDSLAEKTEVAIKEMHRPIQKNMTAEKGLLFADYAGETLPLGVELNLSTYQHLAKTHESEYPKVFSGLISSYNINTFTGRIYLPDENRPVPFTLTKDARTKENSGLIAESMSMNIEDEGGTLYFLAFEVRSGTGLLKRLNVIEVSEDQLQAPSPI